MAELIIKKDISGQSQEASFTNATLQTVGSMAVSISIMLPDHYQDAENDEDVYRMLKEDFTPLVQVGFHIEIQTGLED